jgi:transporter family protein
VRHVNPDLAQLIRTAVVMGAVVALNVGRTSWAEATALSQENWKYLILAGLATAASWICYYRALAVGYASQVAVIDKLTCRCSPWPRCSSSVRGYRPRRGSVFF